MIHGTAILKKYKLIISLVVICILIILINKNSTTNNNFKHFSPPHRRHPPTVNDVYLLAPWMTFDYINNLFNLPSDYFKSILPIDDVRYPQITIKEYSKIMNIDVKTVLENIQNDIKEYMSSSKK